MINDDEHPGAGRSPEKQYSFTYTITENGVTIEIPNADPCPECPDRYVRNTYDYTEQRPLKTTQARLVLQALRDYPNGLTTAELQRAPYNVCHPPARIKDLREAGYRVDSHRQRDLNGMALWVYIPAVQDVEAEDAE